VQNGYEIKNVNGAEYNNLISISLPSLAFLWQQFIALKDKS